MSDLTFGALRDANLIRCPAVWHELEDWSLTDWGCAMAGEVGEACNKIKKLRRGEDIPMEDIGRELADVVIYADLLAARLSIDLGDAVVQKFNEVSDRYGYAGKLERVAEERTVLAELLADARRRATPATPPVMEEPGPLQGADRELFDATVMRLGEDDEEIMRLRALVGMLGAEPCPDCWPVAGAGDCPRCDGLGFISLDKGPDAPQDSQTEG